MLRKRNIVVFKLIVHNLTLLTFLVHAVLGCCAPHVHATLAQHQTDLTGQSSLSDNATPVHPCHHHTEHQTSHSDESDHPTDDSDTCEQTACVYVADNSGTKIQQTCSDWDDAAFPVTVSENVDRCHSFARHVDLSAPSSARLSALRTRATLQSWQV